jgi:hypothetical protein
MHIPAFELPVLLFLNKNSISPLVFTTPATFPVHPMPTVNMNTTSGEFLSLTDRYNTSYRSHKQLIRHWQINNLLASQRNLFFYATSISEK